MEEFKFLSWLSDNGWRPDIGGNMRTHHQGTLYKVIIEPHDQRDGYADGRLCRFRGRRWTFVGYFRFRDLEQDLRQEHGLWDKMKCTMIPAGTPPPISA